MALRHDYPEANQRAAEEVETRGSYPQAIPKLDEWTANIREKAAHADELARSLRNYRRALNGPDPQLERTNVKEIETAPNPSKLVQMDSAIKSLIAAMAELQMEYSHLEDLGIIDPTDQGF